MKYINERHVQGIKDKAVLFAWIAGLLLLISMLWIFTQPLQSYYLMRSVNNVFINSDDMRRLSSSIPRKSEKTNLLGHWYTMFNSTDTMFVFTVFQDGILIPLGAIVSPAGTVEDLIPLSAHAVQVFETLPKSILQMYISRIEYAVQEGER